MELSKGSRDISSPEHIIDPSNKEKRIEDNDDISKCLSSHFSRIGKDSTVNPDFRKYILSYVEEKHVSIGNDETYLPVVFNNEYISVTLKSLKSGKALGVDAIPNDFLKCGGDSMVRSLTELFTGISLY